MTGVPSRLPWMVTLHTELHPHSESPFRSRKSPSTRFSHTVLVLLGRGLFIALNSKPCLGLEGSTFSPDFATCSQAVLVSHLPCQEPSPAGLFHYLLCPPLSWLFSLPLSSDVTPLRGPVPTLEAHSPPHNHIAVFPL